MTWYLKIDAVQPPMPAGLDANERPIVVFNIEADKAPSTTFEEEIIGVLITASLGTFGTSIFSAETAELPIISSDADAFLTVGAQSGAPGRKLQNDPGYSYEMPSAQIVAHAYTYRHARALARAAYLALTVVRNVDVSPAAI